MAPKGSLDEALPRVRFLGTGEAFDLNRPNTALLLEGEARLLIDCGPSVPRELWRYDPDPDALDGVYLSHLHGDHVLGMPTLIGRLRHAGRKKPLTVFGQAGTQDHVSRLVRLAFPNCLDSLGFSLDFVALPPGPQIVWRELRLSCARTAHDVPNYALRVELFNAVFCYSGDGNVSNDTRRFYQGANVLVHEAYSDDGRAPNHATVHDVVATARAQGVRTLCLVHLASELRGRIETVLSGYGQAGLDIRVPEAGFVLPLGGG